MAPRQMKMPVKDDSGKEKAPDEVFSQQKRPERGRYLLQVDRQTKGLLHDGGSRAVGSDGDQEGLPDRSGVCV